MYSGRRLLKYIYEMGTYVSQCITNTHKESLLLVCCSTGALTYTVHMEMTTGNPLMEDEENLI